ncbi:MAG TPA: helix-turn-helix transcriptional regulator [Pseudonocardiaceae bacterium]|nr:helix-turn-helix transcriptional regulator [Pseudonocardiaceae bacterium]
MTATPTRDYLRLAKLARARRLELGLAITAVAEAAGISKDTYRRIEEGREVRDISYARIEPALHWALGSCRAVLEDRKPTPAEPSSTVVTRIELDEDVMSQIVKAAIVTTSELGAAEIRTISDRVIADLKQRGLL